VVSRRVLLQEEERKKAEEARKSIAPGAVLQGRVVSVVDYGAFIDLGGVQGLLHISEMGWGRVTKASEIVRPGDRISVKVLRIDGEKGKISLGLKQLQADPWSKVTETYSVGQVRSGRVLRVHDFGAFVELEPGIEALAHVSTFAPTGTANGWKKAVLPGAEGEFEVLTIEPDRKRIGVALLDESSARAGSGGARPAIVPGARLTGKVEKHEPFGVFVFLAPGRTGLLPAAESGVPRGTDLRKEFPAGSEIEVAVLEVDPGGRKIRLSRKALLDEQEKSDTRQYAERSRRPSRGERQDSQRGSSAPEERTEIFGSSLGDKLREALAARKK
jgi:small subunit ribosomal protein S1